MDKIKLVCFGVQTKLFDITNQLINHETCEIIALCDNDKNKQGIVWNDLYVLSINQLKNIKYDFIVVNAFYSYKVIEQNLIENGISDSKILPLLSLETLKYLQFPIKKFPEDIIEKIFLSNPKKINAHIEEFNEAADKYSRIPPLSSSKKIDFTKYPLVAHAGGGILGNRKLMYTDSLEAFQTSIEAGFKMFEFDVYSLIENDIVFGHDIYRMDRHNLDDYTPLKFSKMLSIISKNPDLKVMLDIKWYVLQDYFNTIDKIEEMLSINNTEYDYNVKNQIFVQCYNAETIEYASKKGYQCLLTSYRNPEYNFSQKSAYLCCKFGVSAVMFSVESILKNFKYLKYFKDKNIPIIAFSSDDIDEYSRLKNMGISSVLTNFMRPL